MSQLFREIQVPAITLKRKPNESMRQIQYQQNIEEFTIDIGCVCLLAIVSHKSLSQL